MPRRVLLLAAVIIWSGQTGLVQAQQVATEKADANPTLDIKDRAKPAATPDAVLVVRHLEKKVDGFQVAETPHFRILHDQKKEFVEKVGRVAEETRVSLQKKWFGDVSIDFDGKCTIYLYKDRDKYLAKSDIKNAVGHMRTLAWGRDVQLRAIHVPCKEPNLLTDVLPHEVAHSVMAVRFQGKLPRWADEGIATLAETPVSSALALARLSGYRKNDGLFSLEVLVQTEEPEHMNTLEYYSQSASLVLFLTAKKGPTTFSQFLRTCVSKGYEPALREHYGIGGFADLERQWLAYAFPEKQTKN